MCGLLLRESDRGSLVKFTRIRACALCPLLSRWIASSRDANGGRVYMSIPPTYFCPSCRTRKSIRDLQRRNEMFLSTPQETTRVLFWSHRTVLLSHGRCWSLTFSEHERSTQWMKSCWWCSMLKSRVLSRGFVYDLKIKTVSIPNNNTHCPTKMTCHPSRKDPLL